MMKKMLQNQISKLKDDFSKKDTELKTTQTALDEEKKKKEKILVNAKRKIQKLNQDLTAARANAGKTSEDGSVTRGLPEGTSADTTKDIAEIKPHVREPPVKPGKVVGTVAPTRLPVPEPQEESPPVSTPVTATVAPQPTPSSPASTSIVGVVPSSSVTPVQSHLPSTPPTTTATTLPPTQQTETPTTTTTTEVTTPAEVASTTTPTPTTPVTDPEPIEVNPDQDLDIPDDNEEQEVLEEPVVSSSVVSTSAQISTELPSQEPESEQMVIPVTSSNQPESSSPGPSGLQSGDTTSLKRSRSPEPDSQDDVTTDAKKSRQEDQEATEEAIEAEELGEVPATATPAEDVLPSEEDDLNDEPQIVISNQEIEEDEIEPPLPDSSVPSRPPAISVPQRNMSRSPLNVPTTPSKYRYIRGNRNFIKNNLGLISNMHGENDDGCVPRTPTLTSGAGVRPHPGNCSNRYCYSLL